MKIRYLGFMLAVILLLAVPTLAQQLPGPSLPLQSTTTFGWVAMSGLDPTLTMLSTFAPPILGLKQAGYNTAFEAADGQFSFSGFHVNSNFESAIASLGPGMFRLSHYGFKSNTASLANGASLGIPPGTLVHTLGDSIELSYAQPVGSFWLGASLVPQDNGDISLSQGGITAVTGSVNEGFGGRIGAVWNAPTRFKLGGDFSYQHATGTTLINPIIINPALAGTPFIPFSGDFLTRAYTVGASCNLYPKTLVYGSYQDLLSKGSTAADRKHANMLWFGVQQNLTDNFVVRVNYLNAGQNVSFSWQTKYGIINAAYTHRALTNAADVLGSGNAAFIGYAAAFK